LRYYSNDSLWYPLSPVNWYFKLLNMEPTRWAPLTPPNNNPGNLHSLAKLSRISSGIMNTAPRNVRKNTLINFTKHVAFLKFYGSKSPWENFMPMIQLCWAISVAAIAIKHIAIAI
jgi:hypothetical protein